MFTSRSMIVALAMAAAFAIFAADFADARSGGGRSIGSRGGNTYSAPPSTNTAPKAAPIERSITQKGAPTSAQNAQSGAGAATQASRFGGWRGLIMGGLIAAGLASIFGLGALASVLGFVLQFALIAGAIYLVMLFLRSRRQPAYAGGQQDLGRTPLRDTLSRQSAGGGYGTASSAAAGALVIGQQDLDTFEKLLGEIQSAYSREDTETLGDLTTPEMLSYFSQDLASNAKQGVRNDISDVKLLQGDLSEAWREGATDYATVAMRFAITDAMVDRKSGAVISGSDQPAEATEFWTFRRDQRAPSANWQLSAIQQAA
jgi:predicted lipid-binding transport protein (Tim44 family)